MSVPVSSTVPGVPHAVADRQQEALDQPGRVRLRRPLPLRRHRPDLSHAPAAHWCRKKISSHWKHSLIWPTGERQHLMVGRM